MNLFLMLNYEMVEIPCEKYYLPIVLIDLRPYKLVCQDVNSLMILMRSPRTNIDLISAVFQFFFETEVEETFLGQVQSNFSILYNMESKSSPKDTEEFPFILFTEGYHLSEIMIYMPGLKKKHSYFLKEIIYGKQPTREGECVICLDQLPLINLHKDGFQHEVCKNCLFKISKCPLCRKDI